jgi:hypothetical protein
VLCGFIDFFVHLLSRTLNIVAKSKHKSKLQKSNPRNFFPASQKSILPLSKIHTSMATNYNAWHGGNDELATNLVLWLHLSSICTAKHNCHLLHCDTHGTLEKWRRFKTMPLLQFLTTSHAAIRSLTYHFILEWMLWPSV